MAAVIEHDGVCGVCMFRMMGIPQMADVGLSAVSMAMRGSIEDRSSTMFRFAGACFSF